MIEGTSGTHMSEPRRFELVKFWLVPVARKLNPFVIDFFVTNIFLLLFSVSAWVIHHLDFEYWVSEAVLNFHAGLVVIAYAKLVIDLLFEIFGRKEQELIEGNANEQSD
jgi:hypothetical protein